MKTLLNTMKFGLVAGGIAIGVCRSCMQSPQTRSLEQVCASTAQVGTRPPVDDVSKYPVSWSVFQDALITPHRGGRYGEPIYVSGSGDQSGDYAVDIANKVIDYENEFSEAFLGRSIPHTYCGVRDVDGDFRADVIEWQRLHDSPRFVAPFDSATQAKADKIILYENQIQDYIRSK